MEGRQLGTDEDDGDSWKKMEEGMRRTCCGKEKANKEVNKILYIYIPTPMETGVWRLSIFLAAVSTNTPSPPPPPPHLNP